MGMSLGPARPCCKQQPSPAFSWELVPPPPPPFSPLYVPTCSSTCFHHRLPGSSESAPSSLGSTSGAGKSVQKVSSVPSLLRTHPSGVILSLGLENEFLPARTPFPAPREGGLGNAACNLPPRPRYEQLPDRLGGGWNPCSTREVLLGPVWTGNRAGQL